jgi:hypothetical protein
MFNTIQLAAASLALLALAPQEAPGPAAPDFVRDVRPILEARCVACHGEKKSKGRLRLDSRALALRGGASGKAIVPGKSGESRLVEALVDSDPDSRMPKDAPPLPPAEIAVLRAWVDAGAPWPDAAAGAAGSKAERHWAYERPVRRDPPAPRNPSWVRNPIDAFVAAELDARKLSPRPEAPRAVLLRRLTLDLIGLPPTRAELRAFLDDASPGAYERVVDRLLADPRYGERWGRHWMDVWRYSDMSEFEGNEILSSQRHLWRWRDWIVDSLNADKGYDRMIVEMIAGDEVAPADPDTLRATGFLARNYYKLNRNVWLDNAVEHTTKAFLATTLNCAKCHNHFFDPLMQDEYYQMRAFFEPYDVRTDPVPGQVDPAKDGLARVYDVHFDAPTYLFVRGEERNADTSRTLLPSVPRSLGGPPVRIEPVNLPPVAAQPGKQEFVLRDLSLSADAEAVKARKSVEVALEGIASAERALSAGGGDAAKLEKERRAAMEELPALLLGASLAEARRDSLAATLAAERIEDGGDRTSEAFLAAARKAQAAQRALAVLEARLAQQAARRAVLRAGDDKKKAELAKKLPAADDALAKAEAEAAKPASAEFARRKAPSYPATSTGRRLALARWIADPANPLTARVAVNHVWMRHFGRALVPSAFDFGTQGQRPSHPALLDWLALELVEHGWSLKALHRLIVTSATYRMDSTPDPAALAADAEDKYLWRVAPRRLEAEAVRDAVLSVTGRLDPSRGGPELDEGRGLDARRRSLYFRHNPEKRVEFLAIFDGPSASECYSRTHTIVPQQALALLNSGLALDGAAVLAGELAKGQPDDAAFASAAFETVLSRPPTPEERDACAAFLASGDPKRSRATLVHALLNHHEFVTIR